MTTFVGAGEAARRLGVRKETLYAYVSRGLIERRVAADGRTSLYAADDLAALITRGRRREIEPRPSIDVQITTAVTEIDETGVRYRGRDVAELARTCQFEQVAELLWTGALPESVEWPEPSAADSKLVHRVVKTVQGPPMTNLLAAINALGVGHANDDPDPAARRVLALVPTVLGERDPHERRPLAARLATCAGSGHPALTLAIDRALVLLADHELATSTLAVRVAGSTGTPAYQAFAAGLAVMHGPLHGGASALAHELLVECERVGAEVALTRRLRDRQRVPGFGHKIYKGEDPRVAPMLDAIALLPDVHGRIDVLDDLLREAGVRMTRRPNIDLGLAALAFIAGLPADLPLFAIGRIAGFAAHLDEERVERPLRFRGLARLVQGRQTWPV